jgi:hypothetical protein
MVVAGRRYYLPFWDILKKTDHKNEHSTVRIIFILGIRENNRYRRNLSLKKR